jgi:aspartyl-tRNA(Asn)/glutamyl-tRNA(Gln) amidotransferase subunit B
MSKPQVGSQPNVLPYSDPILARYQPVIGLEVHCQLDTKTKLFCSCSTNFGDEPNGNTCEVCLGLPGSLPVLNTKAVDFAVKMALAVKGKIRPYSIFARKQYFYPDLPKGYQISQYDLPFCYDGEIILSSGKKISIGRIHMEEDAGKSTHSDHSSYIDLNRAGIPLIEIVSNPELNTPGEATDYLKKLRSLVRYLGISDGDLEKGSFRCDANVSIRLHGASKLGTRCEIKNLNSFKNVERAITYEIMRQADLLDHGETVTQMTVLFDPATGKTKPMRSKEESEDYRYFPDPDLQPLVILSNRIAKIGSSLPELPEDRRNRFQKDFGLSDYDAELLTSDKDLADFFENVRSKVKHIGSHEKLIANWICGEFLREANGRDWNLTNPPITAKDFADLMILIANETISGKIAKTVFSQMVETNKDPQSIVKEKGLIQVTDLSAIENAVDSVIRNHPTEVESFLSGKEKIFGFFIGQLMKISQGKFNPTLLNKILRERLDGLKK